MTPFWGGLDIAVPASVLAWVFIVETIRGIL